MSGLLASVRSTAEASLAAKHGADIIDLKDPGSGALGALPVNTVRTIVQVLDGVRPVSATIGDIAFRAELIRPAILSMAETGVDRIGSFWLAASIRTLGRPSRSPSSAIFEGRTKRSASRRAAITSV